MLPPNTRMILNFLGSSLDFDGWWSKIKPLLPTTDESHHVNVTVETYKERGQNPWGHLHDPGPPFVQAQEPWRPPLTDEPSRWAACNKRGLLMPSPPGVAPTERIESEDQAQLLLGWVHSGSWNFSGYPRTLNSNSLKRIHRAEDLLDSLVMAELEESARAIYVATREREQGLAEVDLNAPPAS